jgi:hypothetical protein
MILFTGLPVAPNPEGVIFLYDNAIALSDSQFFDIVGDKKGDEIS